MLGIVIAMQTECDSLLKDGFRDVFTHTINNLKFYVVTTDNGQNAVITFSGIGKANAAASTAIMVNSFNVDICLNIGSAGIKEGIEVKEVLVVDKTSYGDADATGFGYEINQIPRMPTWYSTDEKVNDEIFNILNAAEMKYQLGICYTSDSFINKDNQAKYNIHNSKLPTVIDMECCAIAQTCHNLGVKFIALKVGIDKLSDPEKNEEQFNKNLGAVAKKIDILVVNLIDAISYKFNTSK